MEALDYVEFFHDCVSTPASTSFHQFFAHDHLSDFDRDGARNAYRGMVNRAFSVLGYHYEMRSTGEVVRLTEPREDSEILAFASPAVDQHLKTLVDRAVKDFYDRTGTRKGAALEAIVDAFERAKTLEDGDKKASLQKVLDRLSTEAEIRATVEAEMRLLTDAGNRHQIRHHETTQIPISDSDVRDYLFYRYFNLVRLILKKY